MTKQGEQISKEIDPNMYFKNQLQDFAQFVVSERKVHFYTKDKNILLYYPEDNACQIRELWEIGPKKESMKAFKQYLHMKYVASKALFIESYLVVSFY